MSQFICCVVLALVSLVSSTFVEVENGGLLGSFNGEYHSFFGIPYAEPPVGVNRFKAPIPLTKRWEGTRSALGPSVSCVQFTRSNTSSVGSEDCLILNVFTPEINPAKPLPVWVYIHGGGFMFGAAGDTLEKFVVRQRSVLVIPNYRVGAFGFLSSGDDWIGGNWGLKDQQLALKWVHNNIHAFGGDAGKVLVSGASAGGASVHLHLLNPSSCDYFSAAYSSSGVALNPWVFQPNPSEQFAKYIRNIGCDLSGRPAVMQCLLERTKEDHVLATNGLKIPFKDNPFNVFGAVVESRTAPDAFIAEDPRSLIKKGAVCDVPWVVAQSEREGSYTAAEFLQFSRSGNVLIDVLNQRWRELAPVILFYNNSCVNCGEEEATAYRNAISDELRYKYMRGQPFSVETYRLLEKMFTDVLFVDGINEAIALHSIYSRAPLYAYEFRTPLSTGIGNVLSMCDECSFGADHASDLEYVLPLKFLVQSDAEAPKSQFIPENLMQMGIDLSITGTATYGGVELPRNTAQQTGKMIIYETYFEIETLGADGVFTKQRYNNAY